jgi:hypothetical protein
MKVSTVMNLFRMLHSFVTVQEIDPSPQSPVNYIRDWNQWDALAFGIIFALLTWLGDTLVVSPTHDISVFTLLNMLFCEFADIPMLPCLGEKVHCHCLTFGTPCRQHWCVFIHLVGED